MSHTLRFKGAATSDGGIAQEEVSCDCSRARKGCMPTFVFSVSGQEGFRQALDHIIHCRTPRCRELKTNVLTGMQQKLSILFDEHALLLGCVYVQPQVYGAKKVRLTKNTFTSVAHHLAHCPKESCARLRRSVMLTIRDIVSPNAHNRLEEEVEG